MSDAITIPLFSDSDHYDLTVVLDGVLYTLELLWNSREEAWHMNVADADGNLIVGGVALVVDFPLLCRCADKRKPPGGLCLVDTSGRHLDPAHNDLGARVQLLYFAALT